MVNVILANRVNHIIVKVSNSVWPKGSKLCGFSNHIAWQRNLIDCLSFLLLKTNDIFRKAVNGIIRLAKDYYKPRFDTEQVSDIKSALNLFGDDRQSRHTAGDFLYLTAKQKGNLDSREQIKAKREVENVVEGRYDYQQKRGFSVRR